MRRRQAAPEFTAEGYPIRHAWWGRCYWDPERKAWFEHETPEALGAKIHAREREQRAARVARQTWSPWGDSN